MPEKKIVSLHTTLADLLKKQGIEKGYVIGNPSFEIPKRAKVIVDVCWEKNEEKILWEVELKARYEEKLFHFHLLKENHPTLKFGLVVQRSDARRQVQRMAEKLMSQEERDSLTKILTVEELSGKKIEEQPKWIPELFWVHRESPKKCVALFSPCTFEDGFNRGLRLTGIYLKEKGYSMNEIADYLDWLAGKMGLQLNEAKSALDQIEKEEEYPSCYQIQQPKIDRGPHILKLGDLDIAEVCKHCDQQKKC